MPKIETDECIACGMCVEACTAEAIDVVKDKTGQQRYKGYAINQDRCVGCEACLDVDCPSGALRR